MSDTGPRVSISIHRTRDGRIRHRVRAWIEGRRRDIAMCDTREEAEAHKRAAEEQLADVDSGWTLAAWGVRWLDRRGSDGNHRSAHKDASRWRAHVADTWLAGMSLRRITRVHVVRWVRELAEKEAQLTRTTGRGSKRETVTRSAGRPVSRQTVVHCLALLRACLRDAADEGLVASNVAEDVRVPRGPGRTDDGWTYLTADEIAALLELELRPEQRAIFTVAIYAGLRAGELWGLRWGDVRLDGDRPEIHVCRSYGGPPKGGKPRHVPLLRAALEALRAWRVTSPGVGDALVFPADRETRTGMHASGFDAEWPDARLAIGITRRCRFHDLRHTCCSHLVMGTWGRAWRLEEVKEYAGHTSITVTQRYAHLAPDALHGARAETDAAAHRLATAEILNIEDARRKKRDDR